MSILSLSNIIFILGVLGLFFLLSDLVTDLLRGNLLIAILDIIGSLVLIVFELSNICFCISFLKPIRNITSKPYIILTKGILILCINILIIVLCVMLDVSILSHILSTIVLISYGVLSILSFIKNPSSKHKLTVVDFKIASKIFSVV
jgi:hypothetical protein